MSYIKNIIFVKQVCVLILIILLFVLNLSCQRSVLERPVNSVDSIDSSSLVFNMPPLENVDMSVDTSSDVLLDNTAEIFLFSEGLMELGRLSDREFFTELGHRVISSFYADEGNYTSYSFCDNSPVYDKDSPCDPGEDYNTDIPYIRVALGAKDVARHDANYLHDEHKRPSHAEHDHLDCDPNKHGEDCDPTEHLTNDTIAGLYSSSMQGIMDYIEDSQLFESRSLDSIDISLVREDPEDPDSDIDYELLLERSFEAANAFFEDVISSIEDDDFSEVAVEVKEGARNAIETARKEVTGLKSHLDMAIEEKDNEGIVDAFESFFGIEDINTISCPENTSSMDLDIHPLCESRSLVTGLQELDELGRFGSFLAWLGGDIVEDLANGINGILPDVPLMIKDIIISQIEGQIDPDNVYNVIYDDARWQARQKIFKDQATLPGVEFSNVQMVGEPNNISFAVEDFSLPTTNGLTLGAAMSVLIERLKQMETFEAGLYSNSKNYQLLFSLFNKSLSMVGHYQLVNVNDDGKTYEEFIPTSFFRPLRFTASQTREDSINPYNYYGDEDDGKTQPGYFAIPEKLFLKKDEGTAFVVNLEKTLENNMISTVASQAELIRGASKVLGYLRPDKLSGYDETMGALNLAVIDTDNNQEADEAPSDGINQPLFPKSSFFNLHLGIAGIVLTNLRRNGIMVHTLEGESVSGNEFQVDQERVTPLLVSVYDVGEEGHIVNEEVQTIDIARLMMAVEEFMLAVKDIDKIDTADLSEFSRKSYKTVSDGEDQLREVTLGLHFAMMVELQREDGCFVNSRNITESHKAKSSDIPYNNSPGLDDEKILLDTQIQSLLALTRFYRRSMEERQFDSPQGGALKRSILRGFSCMTEKLFNDENNFYVTEEGSNQRPSLRMTTDILRLLYKLDFVVEGHTDWMEELNDLRVQWTEAYIEQLEPMNFVLPETGLSPFIIDL